MMELEKLSKKELLEQVRLLQKQSRESVKGIDACKNHGSCMSCDNCSVLHELQVHQLELEMQNKELVDTQFLLEETRDKYADLYDFAPVSYISFNAKGVINNINLTGASMLGEVRSRLLYRPFTLWLDKTSITEFYKHIATVLTSDIKTSVELDIKNRNGTSLNVRIESVRSKIISSDEYICRSVIIDMTETVRIHNEILLQARQLRLITDALPVMIAYLDINEKHLFSNKFYDITFNVLPKYKEQTAKVIWGDEIYGSVHKYLRLAKLGQQVSFDMALPDESSQKKYLNTTLIPDWDGPGDVYGVFILIGDITDRLAIEVMERKRLLDVAHFSRLSSMGEMASEIAHELNQPLAAISTYSSACRRLFTSGKAKQRQVVEALDKISEQAERAGIVIRKIREFVTKKDVNKIKININDIVEDALRLLAVEIRSYSVTLDIDLSPDIPEILVDKILIEQVIFNLLRNALEAMDDADIGERLLKLATNNAGPGNIELIVDDTGPGLSAEKQKDIFHAFHTTKKDGMGMGLAISHSIIQAHHGSLHASNNLYGGARFSFTLPITN